MRKRTLVILLLFGALIALYYHYLSHIVTIEMLKQYRDQLRIFVDNNYTYSALLYCVTYAISVTLSLPIAAIFTIAGGMLFGVLRGALFALVGATTGATGSFLLVRYVVGEWFQDRFQNYLTLVNTEIEKRGAFYLVSLRLFALVPFFVLNMVAGLTKISLGTFVGTTVLGILPGCFVFAYAGQNIATIDSPGDILSAPVLIAFGLLGVLALIPLIFQRKTEGTA